MSGGQCQARYTQRYDAPIEEVWHALADPESRERWLAPPRGVTVVGSEPQRVLELDWSPPGEPPSVVRIELHAEGARTLLVLDLNHAEMRLGDARIFMGNPGESYRNPKEQGGETIGLYIYVDDVDAHHERAKAAGAEITEELVDQEYGDRRYTALDPEGHKWFFATQVRAVAPAEWGARTA